MAHVIEIGVGRSQLVRREAEPLGDAGPEVLDQHVGRCRSRRRNVADPCGEPRSIARPSLPRLLLAISELMPPRPKFGQRAQHLAADARLDLDHLGALIGQEHRGPRTADHLREVDDPDALERSGHALPLPFGRASNVDRRTRPPSAPDAGSERGVRHDGLAEVRLAGQTAHSASLYGASSPSSRLRTDDLAVDDVDLGAPAGEVVEAHRRAGVRGWSPRSRSRT